jgi:hypothetical protein
MSGVCVPATDGGTFARVALPLGGFDERGDCTARRKVPTAGSRWVTRPSVSDRRVIRASAMGCRYGVQVVFMPFGAVSLLFFRRM